MSIEKIVESRISELRNSRKRLVEAHKPWVEAADKNRQAQGGAPLNEIQKENLAQVLENSILDAAGKRQLFETTTGANISFLGIQLPVISALLPSLALDAISTIQALDRRTGSVFYFDVKTGTAKGSTVSSGTKLIDSQAGHHSTAAYRKYASASITSENQGTSTTGTLDRASAVAGTLTLVRGVETFTDAGDGTLVSSVSGGGTGTIVYTTGVWVVTSWAGTGTIYASYFYNYDSDTTNGVPEVNVSVTSSSLTALDFPLRAKYSMNSAIDLERAHGINLEDQIVKYLGGEIKFAIDHYGIDLMYNASIASTAADAIGGWTGTPSSGEEWIWKKYQFIDKIELGSNNIFAKTLRCFANFIVCGNNVARVIRQLGDHFKPAGDLSTLTPTGPIVLGTLDGRTIVQDPFLSTNTYFLGYKGDDFLMSSFIYAPYIPLFSTATLITSDLIAQKGFLSSAGYKVTQPGAFTYGTVSL